MVLTRTWLPPYISNKTRFCASKIGLGFVWGRIGLRRFSCLIPLLLLLQGLFCGSAFSTDTRLDDIPDGMYLNPLGDPPIRLSDPYILVHARKYYLFGTVSPSEGFQCYESADLVHWKLDGWAWRRTPMRAAQGDLHAPQVVAYQGMFCLVYTARIAGGAHLGLAASTQPEGPYHDLHVPWLPNINSCTSADLFVDDNGKPYLLFSQRSSREGCSYSVVCGVGLNKDLSKTLGEPAKLLEPTQRWELARRDLFRYNESPRMFKISGKYFLCYSANDPLSAECAIGYARADKPLGPWTKAEENPLLAGRPQRGVAGLAQGSIFRSLDGTERFLVYSSLADPANPTGFRNINVDRIVPQESRKLRVVGPTRTPQPLPSAPK